MAPNVTDWIDSVMSVLTLAAAVAAGVYAGRAAHWTKAQAEASDEQVSLAKDALEVSRGDAAVAKALAERQRLEGIQAARRLAEERVDATMPTVLVTATPGIYAPSTGDWEVLQIGYYGGERGPGWHFDALSERREFGGDEQALGFAVNVTIKLENVSSHAARVTVAQPDGGEVSVPRSGAVLVRPGATEKFTWRRFLNVGALGDERGVHENGSFARMELTVSDLGLNAYDRVEVLIEHRFFSRDGSRLVVTPESAQAWQEVVGTPLPARVYDRLDVVEKLAVE